MRQYSKYAIAWTVALGMFMAVLDSTIVNVALSPMATDYKVELSSIQWVVTAYFLASAAIIPVSGYFGLRVGLKRLYMASLALFTIGSLLCGLAQSQEMLIIFRVIQGIGGGAIFPLAQSIGLRAFPPNERASASAIIGVSALVAPALGPTIGGFLTDEFGWRTIFLVNIPLGIIAIALAYMILPLDHPAQTAAKARFDVIGLVSSMLGVLSVVYAFTLAGNTNPDTIDPRTQHGEVYGWTYAPVWLFLALGAALLIAFTVYELRFSRDPVLDLRLFKDYGFTMSSIVLWMVSMVVFGSILLLPVFLEQVHSPHLSALDAGLALMPQGIASAVAVLFSGRVLYERLGARWLIMLGAALLIAGSWGVTSLQPDSDVWSLIPWLVLRGLGFGFSFVPLQTRALQSITGPALAKASSLLNVTRQVFSSVGAALVITIFSQQTIEQANSLKAGLKAPPSAAQIQLVTAQAETSAVNTVFLLATYGAVLILVLAAFLPGRIKKSVASAEKFEMALSD